MTIKRSVLIIAAVLSLTALSSCGSSGTANSAASVAPQTSAAIETTVSEAGTTEEAQTTTSAQPEEKSDRRDIPESEWADHTSKAFAANQREAVFKNHQCLEVIRESSVELSEYLADYFWFQKDITYYTGPAFEEFSTPEVRFELLDFGYNYQPKATYYIDMVEGGYQYWPIPTDKDRWMDPEHERIEEMYTEDGKLHINSVYDDTGTETFWGISMWGYDYPGGTVRCKATFNADTYELIETSYYLDNDLLQTESHVYDRDMPRCINSICASFDRICDKTVTVTATANPGEDNELTKSIVVPANVMVSFYAPDMVAPEYYTDRECTQPYNDDWDMESDLTLYIRDGGVS